MGQAKQRGSFEQRKDDAIARNLAVEKVLSTAPKEIQEFQKRHGTQRLVTRMLTAGMFGAINNPN